MNLPPRERKSRGCRRLAKMSEVWFWLKIKFFVLLGFLRALLSDGNSNNYGARVSTDRYVLCVVGWWSSLALDEMKIPLSSS